MIPAQPQNTSRRSPSLSGKLSTRSPFTPHSTLTLRTLLSLALGMYSLGWYNASLADTPDQNQVRGDWPRLLGPNFDSVAIHFSESVDVIQKPSPIWKIDVGDGYGIGPVSDGIYYHFDAVPDRESASRGRSDQINERLRAFRFDDGQELWSAESANSYADMYGYESGPRTIPTIDGDQIFTMGVGGQVNCRRISDGELVWSVDTSVLYGVVQNFFGVGGSPLVTDRQVIVMVGGSPAADGDIAPGRLDQVSPNGTLMVAFDRQTGQEIWKTGDDLASYSSPRTITIDNKTFVLIFARDALWMIDPVNGEVCWKHPHRAAILESVNAMVPVVSGNQVFISECYEVGSALLEVSTDGAKVVWQDPARDRRGQSMRCHWSTPILVDGYLYGCSGRNAPDCDFRCVEWSTGKIMWTGLDRQRSSVTRMGDYLLIWDERARATVLRINPEKMEIVSQCSFDGTDADETPTEALVLEYPCWSAPVVIGDQLLLCGDRNVACLRWPSIKK
jgi:outer membrane protein assembly factor BamB